MKRAFARLATMAVALPFATGMVTGSAEAASVTIPGCYGGGVNSAIVCDLTLTTYNPTPVFTVMYVKVCAGTCQDVPVQSVAVQGTTDICYNYKDGGGVTRSGCATDFLPTTGTISMSQLVVELLGCSNAVCAHY